MQFRSLLLPFAFVLALSACGGSGPSVKAVPDAGYDGQASGAPSALVNPKKDNKQQEAGATIGVNAYLWRAALDTLGFMPLASADPFGGVIITDWYAPPTTSGERFKATAYILGRQLRADGVRITIFRQVRDGAGWTDATVNSATAADIENKVLARARELRADSSKQ